MKEGQKWYHAHVDMEFAANDEEDAVRVYLDMINTLDNDGALEGYVQVREAPLPDWEDVE